jgi:hypothetical protein
LNKRTSEFKENKCITSFDPGTFVTLLILCQVDKSTLNIFKRFHTLNIAFDDLMNTFEFGNVYAWYNTDLEKFILSDSVRNPNSQILVMILTNYFHWLDENNLPKTKDTFQIWSNSNKIHLEQLMEPLRYSRYEVRESLDCLYNITDRYSITNARHDKGITPLRFSLSSIKMCNPFQRHNMQLNIKPIKNVGKIYFSEGKIMWKSSKFCSIIRVPKTSYLGSLEIDPITDNDFPLDLIIKSRIFSCQTVIRNENYSMLDTYDIKDNEYYKKLLQIALKLLYKNKSDYEEILKKLVIPERPYEAPKVKNFAEMISMDLEFGSLDFDISDMIFDEVEEENMDVLEEGFLSIDENTIQTCTIIAKQNLVLTLLCSTKYYENNNDLLTYKQIKILLNNIYNISNLKINNKTTSLIQTYLHLFNIIQMGQYRSESHKLEWDEIIRYNRDTCYKKWEYWLSILSKIVPEEVSDAIL